MKCPNCGSELGCVRASRDSVLTCKDCYLGGPRAELEALAAKLSAVEAELIAETRAQEAEDCETVNRVTGRSYNPAPAPWLEDRIVDLEQQLEAERDRRIEADRPAAVPSIDSLVHDFRALVFAAIAKALAEDGHCKSYEGAVELHCCWPNYFEATGRGNWGLTAARGGYGLHYKLTLHCYLLGPQRHHEWAGSDVQDVFARATADVTGWIAELDEEKGNG